MDQSTQGRNSTAWEYSTSISPPAEAAAPVWTACKDRPGPSVLKAPQCEGHLCAVGSEDVLSTAMHARTRSTNKSQSSSLIYEKMDRFENYGSTYPLRSFGCTLNEGVRLSYFGQILLAI